MQVQRSGDHHRGANKFSSGGGGSSAGGGGGGGGATASSSQQPLTAHPLPMSSSATQSMSSLSRFAAPIAAGTVSSTALSTISGGSAVQANGNDNLSKVDVDRDSSNLS